MRTKLTLTTMAVCLAISSLTHAAESFDINVTGVITPAACQANIAGGATIDYGTIPTEILSADTETVLPAKTANFTITCEAPVKVALAATDNRSGTRITPTGSLAFDASTVSAGLASVLFGLGTDASGNKIGIWMPSLAGSLISTDQASAVDVINSTNGGTTWTHAAGSDIIYNGNVNWRSIANPGETTPTAFTTLNGILQVQAAIAPTSTLDLSEPVTLDGSATIEMIYL